MIVLFLLLQRPNIVIAKTKCLDPRLTMKVEQNYRNITLACIIHLFRIIKVNILDAVYVK